MSGTFGRLGFPTVHVEPGALVIHAASFGEARIAAALAASVARTRPEVPLVRTYTRGASASTDTGAWQTLPWPLDLPGVPEAWLDRVRPRAVWLCEAELWPGMLAACRRRGIPVAVVAAPARPGTLRLLRWMPRVADGVRWLAADRAAGARLRAVLGPAVDPEPTGDLKVAAPAAPAAWPRRPDRPVLVAGSTHAADEAALLQAWRAVLRDTAAGPRPLLVIAPRAPSRAGAVRRAAQAHGLAVIPWDARADRSDADVVLIDVLGVLAGVYPHATAAFVGGTFGGGPRPHAPGEALAHGLPVVGGPGGVGVGWDHPRARAVGVDALPEALRAALADGPDPRAAPGSAVADDVVTRLNGMLDAPIPPERCLRPWFGPLGRVWDAAVGVRARRARARAPVPVVAIGALVAGGAGKTEVAAWVAAQLPGAWIVARGYGRSRGAGSSPVRVAPPPADGGRCGGWNPPPQEQGRSASDWLGDELAMLSARGFGVVSAPGRHDGATAAVAAGARCVVLDDGWTAPGLVHDVAIVCVDARRPTGGAALPAGDGKVPPERLATAHAVVCLHGAMPPVLRPHVRDGTVIACARYVPVGWIHAGREVALPALAPCEVDVLVGIAHPGSLLRLLRGLGFIPRDLRRRADHHPFGQADRDWIAGVGRRQPLRPVVTTAKDLVRLQDGCEVWALRVDLAFESGEAALRALLARSVAPGTSS